VVASIAACAAFALYGTATMFSSGGIGGGKGGGGGIAPYTGALLGRVSGLGTYVRSFLHSTALRLHNETDFEFYFEGGEYSDDDGAYSNASAAAAYPGDGGSGGATGDGGGAQAEPEGSDDDQADDAAGSDGADEGNGSVTASPSPARSPRRSRSVAASRTSTRAPGGGSGAGGEAEPSPDATPSPDETTTPDATRSPRPTRTRTRSALPSRHGDGPHCGVGGMPSCRGWTWECDAAAVNRDASNATWWEDTGAGGYRMFMARKGCDTNRLTHRNVGECLRGKHILLMGDSITRYQYYSLVQCACGTRSEGGGGRGRWARSMLRSRSCDT
jgi:hypothetical protein